MSFTIENSGGGGILLKAKSKIVASATYAGDVGLNLAVPEFDNLVVVDGFISINVTAITGTWSGGLGNNSIGFLSNLSPFSVTGPFVGQITGFKQIGLAILLLEQNSNPANSITASIEVQVIHQ